MTIVDPSPVRSSPLVARIKAILLTPTAEWERIDAEPATIQGLYLGYVAILAAVPVLARLIGGQVFGYGAFFVHWRPSIVSSVTMAIVGYVLSLVSVFIIALIIDALAPTFDGQKNQVQAFKVAAYANTASWVVGVCNIFPPLAVLGLLGGLYSLYLLYLGLPKLMKAPQEKALAYTGVTIIVAIVLSIVVGAVTGGMMMARFAGGGYPMAAAGHMTGTVNLPGGSVDLGKLDAASKQMQAAASQMQAAANAPQGAAGTIKAVPGDVLQNFLPSGLGGGLARTDVSSNSASAGGLGGSDAEGVYGDGGARHINLKVADLGAAGALASLGGALNVNSSHQTATSYEKVNTVNGRMTDESYDSAAKSGKYSVIVASRFLIEADGDGVAMDDLKAAVGSVNAGALEGLAKAG